MNRLPAWLALPLLEVADLVARAAAAIRSAFRGPPRPPAPLPA